MPTKAKTAEVNDGRVSLAEARPGTGAVYDGLTSFGAPKGTGIDLDAIPVKARQDYRTVEVNPDTVLPFLGVARAVADRRIRELYAVQRTIELSLRQGVIGAGGQVVPYLLEKRRIDLEELDRIDDEVGRLGAMTDEQVRRWAKLQGVQ